MQDCCWPEDMCTPVTVSPKEGISATSSQHPGVPLLPHIALLEQPPCTQPAFLAAAPQPDPRGRHRQGHTSLGLSPCGYLMKKKQKTTQQPKCSFPACRRWLRVQEACTGSRL